MRSKQSFNLYALAYVLAVSLGSLCMISPLPCVQAKEGIGSWPHIPRGYSKKEPSQIIKEARADLAAGNFDAAIAVLTGAISERPDIVAFFYYRAQALMGAKRYKLALSDCFRMVKMEPQEVKTHEMRAHCFVALGQAENAARDWSRIVELQPSNAAAHEQLAQYYKGRGDAKNATREAALARKYRSVGSFEVSDAPGVLTERVRNITWMFDQALRDLNAGKTASTLASCEKMLSHSDAELKTQHMSRGEIFELQAQARQKLGQHEQAVASFDNLLSLNPKNARAYFMRAQSLFELGRFDECVVDCQRAAQGDKILAAAVAELSAKASAKSKQFKGSGIKR